ncbi:LacI family transcriptional regulator [Isoptericola variabilis J7]|uniref:Transcriptional regulator, LacI family n=1 Tax=Isoptericola variabilis (strain 225) TaxID=743718 RepID=F6FUP2_ISOV2|nr:transcriptional regulator, LacI family [Isoptericola variabilis 225]TWH35238.1 LacI family transcriptional regulator [Isoptericola variabilis J7]
MPVARPGASTRRTVVTIADVAAAAGVSRATVSRVMNGRSTVDPAISARVQEAAIELNYRPSNVARSLSLGRTTTVALVVPDLGNPVFQRVLGGVTSAAAEDGYRVLVADAAEDPGQEAAIARDARQRCDALILMAPRMPDAVLAGLLPDVEPAVVINRELASSSVPTLVVDYADATVQVLEHLVELGHRRVAYLAGPPAAASDAARRRGIAAVRQEHPDLEVTVLPAGADIEAGHAAAGPVLASRVTAVVAFNDLVSFGLLAALNEAGVAVPADISVAGFDDIELARYATPALTTVAVPQVDLGRHAWRELHAVIDDSAQPATTTRFGAQLQVRASTGPVPPRVARAAVQEPDRRPEDAGAAQDAARPEQVPTWTTEGGAVVLHRALDHVALARYEPGTSLPTIHSPRPYLHPLHTLAGVPLTDVSPVDHRHHYGVSMAVPDVNGTSHWGGRTFVADVGPTLLPNHGRQTSTHTVVDALSPHVLLDTVLWSDEHGAPQLEERRRVGARLLGDDGWVLEWRSTLHAAHGPLEIRSPATNGRPGAGYGGVFWRLPVATSTRVLSAAGEGEGLAHGSASPWVAFVQRHSDHQGGERATTLLLTQTSPARHWFLRAAEYPGACPALAWDTPLLVPAGGTVETGVVAALLDRELDAAEAAELATGLR